MFIILLIVYLGVNLWVVEVRVFVSSLIFFEDFFSVVIIDYIYFCVFNMCLGSFLRFFVDLLFKLDLCVFVRSLFYIVNFILLW